MRADTRSVGLFVLKAVVRNLANAAKDMTTYVLGKIDTAADGVKLRVYKRRRYYDYCARRTILTSFQ